MKFSNTRLPRCNHANEGSGSKGGGGNNLFQARGNPDNSGLGTSEHVPDLSTLLQEDSERVLPTLKGYYNVRKLCRKPLLCHAKLLRRHSGVI
ncbi:hypothetical protein D3C73_1117480 [compost metagenome]